MCPYFEQWYVYDIYGTKYKYFHSLNQWYIYDIYGTNISLEQWYVYDIYGTNMSILKTMICIWYLWNKYVRTWNNYMGLSLLNLNVKEQVYSYRNRTSLLSVHWVVLTRQVCISVYSWRNFSIKSNSYPLYWGLHFHESNFFSHHSFRQIDNNRSDNYRIDNNRSDKLVGTSVRHDLIQLTRQIWGCPCTC